MSTTLEVKLRTAALNTPALTALLGTSPFRWYDMQLDQNSPFPAVTVQLISTINAYVTQYRLQTASSRVQFTVWDTDPERARQVETAIVAFLDTFNAVSPATNFIGPVPQPVRAVNRRQGGNAQTQPLTFWRTIDALVLNNETF